MEAQVGSSLSIILARHRLSMNGIKGAQHFAARIGVSRITYAHAKGSHEQDPLRNALVWQLLRLHRGESHDDGTRNNVKEVKPGA